MDKWAYILASFLCQIESELEELQLPENNTPMEKSVGVLFITNGKHFVFLCILGSSSAKVILQKKVCYLHVCSTVLGCKLPVTWIWDCLLLTETADNPVSETTELHPFRKTKQKKNKKKKKERKQHKEAWRWLYLATFTFLYKNSSIVHVFNTDLLLTTNSKEKQKTRGLRKWEK